jgi:hypothetical protein
MSTSFCTPYLAMHHVSQRDVTLFRQFAALAWKAGTWRRLLEPVHSTPPLELKLELYPIGKLATSIQTAVPACNLAGAL